MNKEELKNRIMGGLRESLNEAKAFDPKNNKNHKEAYNSFVKWYNKWKEKLGREEIRGLIKKVTNDALGDNLDMINESRKPGENNDSQAFDLFLWFENTQDLWVQYGEWTSNCILKRLRRNQPVLEDYLAKSSIVEKAAMATIKSYNKEFPGTYVSSATRKNLRERIAHKIYEYAMDEWDYEQNNE